MLTVLQSLCQNGRRVREQLRSNGQVLTPFHLDGTAIMHTACRWYAHTWDDSQLAWDNGRMANWPTHKTDISMGYFKEKEIPYQFALANAFTICDAYHCSMHTGTDANRSFHLTGTNGATPTKRSFVNTNGTGLMVTQQRQTVVTLGKPMPKD